MEQKKSGADIIASLLLLLLSGIILYESCIMPRSSDWGFYASPALAPLLFAVIIIIFSIILMIRALYDGGIKNLAESIKNKSNYDWTYIRQVCLILAVITLYILMLGTLHFVILSSLAIFVQIIIFKGTTYLKAALLAVTASSLIWALFTFVFVIPLP